MKKNDPNIFVCNEDVLGSNTPSLNYRIKQKQKTKKLLAEGEILNHRQSSSWIIHLLFRTLYFPFPLLFILLKTIFFFLTPRFFQQNFVSTFSSLWLGQKLKYVENTFYGKWKTNPTK